MTATEAFDKVWEHVIHEGKQQPTVNGVEVWIRPEMRAVSSIEANKDGKGDRSLTTRYVDVSVGADGEYGFIKGDEATLILLATVIS